MAKGGRPCSWTAEDSQAGRPAAELRASPKRPCSITHTGSSWRTCPFGYMVTRSTCLLRAWEYTCSTSTFGWLLSWDGCGSGALLLRVSPRLSEAAPRKPAVITVRRLSPTGPSCGIPSPVGPIALRDHIAIGKSCSVGPRRRSTTSWYVSEISFRSGGVRRGAVGEVLPLASRMRGCPPVPTVVRIGREAGAGSPHRVDAVLSGVDVHRPAAQETDQRHALVLGELDGQRGGSGHRGQHRDAGHRCFLDE